MQNVEKNLQLVIVIPEKKLCSVDTADIEVLGRKISSSGNKIVRSHFELDGCSSTFVCKAIQMLIWL
jgi:hypothetical protein